MKTAQFADKLLLATLGLTLVLPVIFLKLDKDVVIALIGLAGGQFGALGLLIKQNVEARQENKIINSEVNQPISGK